MTAVQVVAAVFSIEGYYALFRKSRGRHFGYWEFPGGKIEPGETPESAIIREINEELNIDILKLGGMLDEESRVISNTQFYIKFFKVESYRGDFELRDHDSLVWFKPEHFHYLNISELDKAFIEKYFG